MSKNFSVAAELPFWNKRPNGTISIGLKSIKIAPFVRSLTGEWCLTLVTRSHLRLLMSYILATTSTYSAFLVWLLQKLSSISCVHEATHTSTIFDWKNTHGFALCWGQSRIYLLSSSRPPCLDVKGKAVDQFLLRESVYPVRHRRRSICPQVPYYRGSRLAPDPTTFESKVAGGGQPVTQSV